MRRQPRTSSKPTGALGRSEAMAEAKAELHDSSHTSHEPSHASASSNGSHSQSRLSVGAAALRESMPDAHVAIREIGRA
eukprot:4169743-Prymnesium_polylepis.1